jgi:hypothetical protein
MRFRRRPELCPMGEGGDRAASTITSPFGAPVAGFRDKGHWV